jgi:hypothetical protein
MIEDIFWMICGGALGSMHARDREGPRRPALFGSDEPPVPTPQSHIEKMIAQQRRSRWLRTDL